MINLLSNKNIRRDFRINKTFSNLKEIPINEECRLEFTYFCLEKFIGCKEDCNKDEIKSINFTI